MRALLIALACAPLSGCFFFFIPGTLIDKIAGNPAYCVAPGAKVGDKFQMNGIVYEVTAIAGDSQYVCRNQPEGRRFGVDAKPV